MNDDAKLINEVKLDSPVKYVSVSNTGRQFATVLANNTILFFNQSETPVWALSSDIPISAITIIKETVISGDFSGCVYALNNPSVFGMPHSSSDGSVVGNRQAPSFITSTITTSTPGIPKSTIVPPENSGIQPVIGIEYFYYLLFGILLIGLLVEGLKALKRKRNY